MASQQLPGNTNFLEPGTWPTLLGAKGYKLFAVGNGSAVIVEPMPEAGQQPGQNATGRFGSTSDGNRQDATEGHPEPLRPVLLTHVFRTSRAAHPGIAGEDPSRQEHAARWQAVRRIQPIAQLKSYLDKQCGSFTFFFTRSPRKNKASLGDHLEVVAESAECIGHSLGLGQEDLEALRVAGRARELEPRSFREAPPKESVSSIRGQIDGSGDCNFPECKEAATASLLEDRYCLAHFITVSYGQLYASLQQLAQRPASEEAAERLRTLLSACIDQSTSLTREPYCHSTLVRARLIDIRYTASELRRRLRRSPRVADSRPVRLVCETPGRSWQEDTRTHLISRYGTLFACEHLIRPEDRLFLERLDNGTRTRARMVWRRPGKLGCFATAVEFLDSENFWELNWAIWTDPLPSQKLAS